MFSPKTVDSVMKTFTKAAADLEAVAAQHIALRNGHLESASEHANSAAFHSEQHERAQRVREKIADIIA